MMKIFFIFFIFLFSFKSFGKAAPDSFADLVDDLLPTVVTIRSSALIQGQQGEAMPQFPEFPKGHPFNEFFKDYFNQEQRRSETRKPVIGVGSGFIVDNSGIIVTNNHVIESADEINVILHDQTEYTAELLGRDPKADLAVLKIDTKNKELKSISWGDSNTARVGDWTIAIGNPLGLGGSVTAGIVSAISRDIGSGPYVQFIQTDASINRGNSGGPLFNTRGEVIGINTAIISQTGGSIGLGFAIPSNSAKKIVSQLREFGRTKRGWLGVEITNVTVDIAESLGLKNTNGAFISNLNPKGPSKKAGLQEGDIILRFNNVLIEQMKDLPRLVAESDIGSKAIVEVWRKNTIITIEVILGELPEKSYTNLKQTKEDNNLLDIVILGITIKQSNNNEGVIVVKVGQNINLLIDDQITEVNREKISTTESFVKLIENIKKTGRNSLLLKVLREDKLIWVTVKFKD